MLDKIFNISSHTEFVHKSSNFDIMINRHLQERQKKNDSLNFSPALLYLKNINWKLNQFKVLASKKVFCSFDILGYRIETIIDVLPATLLSEIFYNITNKTDDNYKEITASLKVIINTPDLDDELLNDLSFLNSLFDRLYSLNLKSELNKMDSVSLIGLLSGISNGVYHEFCSINYHMFRFVEKMMNIKLLTAQSSNYEKVFLNSIKKL